MSTLKAFCISLFINVVLLFITCSNDNNPVDKNGSGQIKDNDGNTYKTTTIGTQVWLAENYKATKMATGAPIRYAEPYDENTNYLSTYGLLYHYETITDSNFPPSGWRVPTLEDYKEMFLFLGTPVTLLSPSNESSYFIPDTFGIYYKLFDVSKYYLWDKQIWELNISGKCNNESGFDVLPGGYYSSNHKGTKDDYQEIGFNTKFAVLANSCSYGIGAIWFSGGGGINLVKCSNDLRLYVRLIKDN